MTCLKAYDVRGRSPQERMQLKEKMREVDGACGGEVCAHHYFHDVTYADSGMILWSLVTASLSSTRKA